jgi:hypothetical protein
MSDERRAADPADPTKWVAPSGATSSARKPEYRLVPFTTIKRIGQRLTDGARKHGEGNWEKALDDRDFMMDRANHLIEHAYRAIEKLQKGIFTDDDDDDLGGVGANLAFLIGYQEHQRNLTRLSSATAETPHLSEKSKDTNWPNVTIGPICNTCNHRHHPKPGETHSYSGPCTQCNCREASYASPD